MSKQLLWHGTLFVQKRFFDKDLVFASMILPLKTLLNLIQPLASSVLCLAINAGALARPATRFPWNSFLTRFRETLLRLGRTAGACSGCGLRRTSLARDSRPHKILLISDQVEYVTCEPFKTLSNSFCHKQFHAKPVPGAKHCQDVVLNVTESCNMIRTLH